MVDCLCGLMIAKELIVHGKWESSYHSQKPSVTLNVNLVSTSEVLQTCYGKHENIEQFGKAILTTPVNISYNKVEFKVFTVKRYTELIE